MKKFFMFMIVGLFAAVSAACAKPKGEILRKQSPFSAIGVTGNLTVIYEQGNSYGVRIVGDESLAKFVDTEVVGNTLELKNKTKKVAGVYTNAAGVDLSGLTLYVTAPDISFFSLTGSGRMTIGKMTARNVSVYLTGSGSIVMSGISAGEASINCVGAGSITGTIQASNVALTMTGVGAIKADITKAASLICSTTGLGSINVSGNVGKYTKTMVGNGTIHDSALSYQSIAVSTVGRNGGNGNQTNVDTTSRPRSANGIVAEP